jgi:phenazine biosynthesis protein phzE
MTSPAARCLADLATEAVPPPFAVLRREGRTGVELLVGRQDDVQDVDRLADLPLPGPEDLPVLAMVPFRQVAELGFAHHDDGAPLRCLRVRERHVLDPAEAVAALPPDDVPLAGAGFDTDDDTYREVVKRIIEDEIGHGQGANFVVRRELRATQPLAPARAALAVLGRLLAREAGAYWTFAVHLPAPAGGSATTDLTAVGATPERHVSAAAGRVVMNPISGTFRYPENEDAGSPRDQLLAFLRDRKEVEELFMVVDEELKMMSCLADAGGQVHGPLLKPMSHLAHTEYLLTGRSDADVRDVLRGTMFAATVTGSPLENACRVIARYETGGRGHYAGMAALVSAGSQGPELDAPLLIRTAYLGADGSVRVPVGATLVRHSVPEREVAETHAKSAGVLSAFAAVPVGRRPARSLPAGVVTDPEVAAALVARNRVLARFWLDEQTDRPDPRVAGRTVLVVDAEDTWTAMLSHVLRRLGMVSEVRRWDAVSPADVERPDLLVAGPGPGDPRDLADPRIAGLYGIVAARTAGHRPLLAVCLSHQIVAGLFGLQLAPLAAPYQGTQRRVRVFDREVRVGFYNTFTARPGRVPPGVRVWTAGESGEEVVALGADRLASVQFHLESILSPDGVDLLADLVADLLVRCRCCAGPDAEPGAPQAVAGSRPGARRRARPRRS